ncbi:integrase domain-containing protein [Haliea sp.]|uniref:integrase domain-containing protein n=1 Tax=Haliea sp. TaxID=1932666 RepID=UPI003527CAE5
MARTTKPLTNTEVLNAKARAREYNLVDGAGLKLRVKPNGTRTWLFNYYRPHIGKRANMTLGAYPDITLAAARRLAEDARALIAREIDPQEYRAEQARHNQEAHATTFEQVARKWMAIKKGKITAGHADDIWRSFEIHLLPDLGTLPIHKIRAPAVIAVLEPLAAKGTLETVKRLTQRVNEVMTYAVNTGLIDANPLAGIGKAFHGPDKQRMPTLKPEQLPDLMRALTGASIKLTTRYLIEWMLHTMARSGEAAGARWEEIDWEDRVWGIPASRMKNSRPHSVPLSPQAMNLLFAMKPLSGHREFIFTADRNSRKHTHTQTANMALRRMGYQGKLVAHGLRALASTTLNEQGFDPDLIEAALSHIDSNEVRSAYNRADYLSRRRGMMDWWSRHIEEAATGNMSLAASETQLA